MVSIPFSAGPYLSSGSPRCLGGPAGSLVSIPFSAGPYLSYRMYDRYMERRRSRRLNPLFSGAIPFIWWPTTSAGKWPENRLNPLFSGAIPFIRTTGFPTKITRRRLNPLFSGAIPFIDVNCGMRILQDLVSQSPFQRAIPFIRQHHGRGNSDHLVSIPFSAGPYLSSIRHKSQFSDEDCESQSPFQRGHTFHSV